MSEISEDQVPGRSTGNRARNWLVAETVSRQRGDATAREPRKFTARKFSGTEGDELRYTTEEGFARTETTWVHPPTIETGARESGQTEPLYVRGQHEDAISEATDEPRPPKSLKDLAGGIHDAPFDECVEFEAANEKMKTLHIKSDSGVGRMQGSSA
ncbi:hypothetical protein SLS55_004548 [Diplodia seriata]|uniref:Uncharacterized protein n=1 Tax=Diplodia seriata TaxID=420778 RepID=A0ABR3CMD5_9PEZI